MPELPDVELYLSALRPRIVGQPLQRVRIVSPFFVRTFDPPITALEHQRVVGLRRMGKRLVWSVGNDLFAVFHLMIAGRFRWTPPGAPVPGKVGLAAFDFDEGTLICHRSRLGKQASLHVVRGEDGVAALDPGGLEVFDAHRSTQFAHALRRENHTLKRALTDPHLFSGIGNAYSDEILHAAQLSPLKLTQSMTDERSRVLLDATHARSSQLDRTAACARPAIGFRRRSPRSGRRWRCMAAMASRARGAARRFSASSTRGTSRTTARRARPTDACSPIGRCRASSATTGQERWKTSSAAETAELGWVGQA